MSLEHHHFSVLESGPQKRINEIHRSCILVLGGFCGICASFSYAFNLFSGSMQSVYHLNQRNLTIISTVGIILQYMSLPYAFLFDYLGPMIIAIIGVLYFSVGSVTLALCFRGQIEGSVVKLSVFNGFLMCGCSMFDMISCVTVVSYFPTRKGAVVAIIKSLIGLGQSIIGSIYIAFFDQHIDYYFFFLMAFTAIIGCLAVAFMRLPSYHLTNYQLSHWSNEKKATYAKTKSQYLRQSPPAICFIYAFVIVILLIISLPTETALVTYLSLNWKYKYAFAIVTIILTFTLIAIIFPISFIFERHQPRKMHTPLEPVFDNIQPDDNENDPIIAANRTNINTVDVNVTNDNVVVNESSASVKNMVIPDDNEYNTEVNESQSVNNSSKNVTATEPAQLLETEVDYIAPQYQQTFIESLKTPELWALGWTIMNTAGLTLTIIFNSSFILGALQGSSPDSSMRTLLTVLNGVGSAVGRLIMSYFEYWCHSQRVEDRVPFTLSLYFNLTTGIIAIILFLTLPAKALPLPYVLTALDNGFSAAAVVLVTRTIYAKDPAKYYNFCFMSVAVAALVYNRFVYGEWYNRQAEKQNNADKLCYGKECVSFTLYFILGMTCSSLISATYVHLRYRKYCKLVLAERRHLRNEAEEDLSNVQHPLSIEDQKENIQSS